MAAQSSTAIPTVANEFIIQSFGTGSYGAVNVEDDISLPAGFGDCLVMEAYVRLSSVVDAPGTVTTISGGRMLIRSAAGQWIDFIGAGKYIATQTTELAVQLAPDQLAYWPKDGTVMIDLSVPGVTSTAWNYTSLIRVRRLTTPS